MKIHAIRVKNLASLDGTTEIDFTAEPLRSAGIFAITGPTGAGKSTILDALCLALYAKTPRYRMAENGIDVADVKGNTIKQDDVRGILRDGSTSGFASVDFTGVDGQIYRSSWNVRRAYNREDGSLQPYEMALKNLSANQDIPGKKTELLSEIEQLVGLNFEQFTRSVLLAQGDFTAFLKAGRDEKASLLEKLTGTQIYSEISQKIYDHFRDEQQKLRELNYRREGIIVLSKEEIDDLREQKAVLRKEVDRYSELLSELKQEQNWHLLRKELEESRIKAEEQYRQSKKQKLDASSRELHMEQIAAVQPAIPRVNNLHHHRTQKSIRQKDLYRLAEEIALLNQKMQSAEKLLSSVKQLLDEKIRVEEESAPQLNEARALDLLISEKKKQEDRVSAECQSLAQKSDSLRKEWEQTRQLLREMEEEINNLSRWMADNAPRRPIAEQEKLIRARLSDAEIILKSLREYGQRVSMAKEEAARKKQENQVLEIKLKTLRDTFEQKQNEECGLRSALLAVPMKEWEKEKQQLDYSIEKLIGAEAHWRLLYKTILEEAELTKSLKDHENELEEKIRQLSEAERTLAEKKSARDASMKMLESVRLETTANVRRLRELLQSGEPCPVCGSPDHPFAKEHLPKSDSLLSKLEITQAGIEEEYSGQLSLCGSLRQHRAGLEKAVEEIKANLSRKNDTVAELKKEWLDFPIQKECADYPSDKISGWLQETLQKQKAKQQQRARQLEDCRKEKETLEVLSANLVNLEKQLNNTENKIKDHNRDILALMEQMNNDEVEFQNNNERLEDIKESLSTYFTDGEWFENWQSNPGQFVCHIVEFTKKWKENSRALEELEKNSGALKEKYNGIDIRYRTVAADADTKKSEQSRLKAEYEDLSGKRKSLFNGKPAEEVERKMKEEVDDARKKWEQQNHAMDIIHMEKSKKETLYQQAEKDISLLDQQEKDAEKSLFEWLDGYNLQNKAHLSADKLDELLAVPANWIEKERKELRALDNAMTQAKSIFEERDRALESHLQKRISDRTPEEVKRLSEETQAKLTLTTRQMSEIEVKLNEDERKQKQIGSLLENIEQQSSTVENWARLNELIGSADGKKFRQIAQEYTLDVLLNYANAHLQAISNRYVLQRIPHSLGLQVIDKDMGDDMRTVFSLSGGESFLVSLALALGLASLSSSRMKVESLFIDEGFGSLDPSTLSVAMDALDRLHNQGRKVGVISHVQEMTERIPVQIRVNKLHSGKSKVEVIGF